MRISYKNIETLLKLFKGKYKVSKMQWLGNRKNYYYEYTLYENNNLVMKTEKLRDIYFYLINLK